MNKKTILLFTFFVTSVCAQAQAQQQYYTTPIINGEFISKRVEQIKKDGADEKEVQHLKDHLNKLMQKQKEEILAGTFVESRLAPPPQVLSGCINTGFEDGTTNGWTLQSGSASLGLLPCPTCITGAPGSGVYEIVGAGVTSNVNTTSCACSPIDCSTLPCTGGIDGFGGFSVVAPAPLGGNSLLMNNSDCNYLMEKASQTFLVGPTNNSFTFGYAVVLQSGGHPPSAQAYFSVDVIDVATGQIIPCTQYNSSPPSSGSLNGWSVSTIDNSVLFQNWQITTLDLSAVMGQSVTVEFTVSDCGAGGHFGYCYIDASCGPNQITSSNILCTGGTTTLSGPPGFASYSWTGPVTGNTQNLTTNTPGTYTLTTTTSTGCSAPMLTYTLTQNSGIPPTVTLQIKKDSICSGAIDTLIASGADTYVWSNSATNDSIYVSPTSSITYSVTGTNTVSGCANTATKTIVITPIVILQVKKDSICSGAIDTLIASGADTYVWSNSATNDSIYVSPTINTTYTVTGTDVSSGCTNSTTKTIYINVVSIQATSYSVCIGNTDTLTAIGASTYTWSSNAGGATTNSVSVSPTVNTTYTVTGQSNSGCVTSSTYSVSAINCTTNTNQFSANINHIVVYPNPANGILTVECKFKNAELFIYDVLGNKIMQLNPEKEITSIDISSLNKGIYFLNVKTVNANFTKKFIVQR